MTDSPDTDAIETAEDDIIAAARRRYGGLGAGLAAGMLGLDIALTGKKKPDSVQVQESPTDPVDIDQDGITVDVDTTTSVTTPALDRRPPIPSSKRRRR